MNPVTNTIQSTAFAGSVRYGCHESMGEILFECVVFWGGNFESKIRTFALSYYVLSLFHSFLHEKVVSERWGNTRRAHHEAHGALDVRRVRLGSALIFCSHVGRVLGQISIIDPLIHACSWRQINDITRMQQEFMLKRNL